MTTSEVILDLKKINPEKILLFVGSGIVKSLGYPSWAELLNSGVKFTKNYSPEVAAIMESRIRKGQYLHAGSAFFETEIPPHEFINFMQKEFDRTPEIPEYLVRLFSCPFTGFITTNFDFTIEQSFVCSKKNPEVYASRDRFKKFSSRLQVYGSLKDTRNKNGLLLKMHADSKHVEEIVLCNEQFQLLGKDESFRFLYRSMLSQYHVVFFGFSGNDPNFLWHCDTLFEVCGTPINTSYFLYPNLETAPSSVSKANIIPVPFSIENNFKELQDFINQLCSLYTPANLDKLRIPEVVEDNGSRDSLAFVCAGLSENAHTSTYQCAIVSIVTDAVSLVGSYEDKVNLAQTISRKHHISISDANKIIEQADEHSVLKALEHKENSKERVNKYLKVLKDGISKRTRAYGKPFQKSDPNERVIIEVLVSSLFKAGFGLALSLMDSEAPEAAMVDKVLRKSIEELNLPGIGDLDKELLLSGFADMFTRPTREEGIAITSIAQAAVATALAVTFSGGLDSILELMPSEAYFDANVVIPLVSKDHPRSINYHELIVGLSRIHCDTLMLDVFLDEMVHHCQLAYDELREAKITKPEEAKAYAEFHSPLGINAFVAAYANGAKRREPFPAYLQRVFGSVRPKEKDFKRLVEALGIEVISTERLDKSAAEPLSILIASEKGRLMRVNAQILANHEAVQILWLHKEKQNKIVWFVTEDATLRRILRVMPSLEFSQELPSKGVMPAYGAHLLISSFSERPNLEKTFSQLLWNPTYLEQVDTMLSSVLKKFSGRMKELQKLDILELRDKAAKEIQKEMARNEKDAIRRRGKEFLNGEPELVKSILREIGDQ